MDFEKHKERLHLELDRFAEMLGEVLPKYLMLMKKKNPSDAELQELGELEHTLIEVNAKIAELKNKLDHDLFGETLDEYFKLKQEAASGDIAAKKRFDKLREVFKESLKDDTFFNWNWFFDFVQFFSKLLEIHAFENGSLHISPFTTNGLFISFV